MAPNAASEGALDSARERRLQVHGSRWGWRLAAGVVLAGVVLAGVWPATIPFADLTAQLGPPLPEQYRTGVAAPPFFVDLASTIGTKWYHSPVRAHLQLVHWLIVAVTAAQRHAGYTEDANCLEPLADSTASLEDFVRVAARRPDSLWCHAGYGKASFLQGLLGDAAATLVRRYWRIHGELVANYIMRVAELGGARVDWPDDEPARP